MTQELLPLQNPPLARRGPGRPKGARNRRSSDLARYVEARFGGMTPGQQSAELALVTPKELKRAGGSMLQAMANKARELAEALGCETRDAFLLLQKERGELLAYIHQKQPQAAPKKPGERAVVLMVPEGQALDQVDAAAEPSLSFIDDDEG